MTRISGITGKLSTCKNIDAQRRLSGAERKIIEGRPKPLIVKLAPMGTIEVEVVEVITITGRIASS